MIFDQQTLLYLACSQLTTSIYWPAIVLSKFMLSLLFAIVSGPFGWKGICASFLKLLVYFYIDVVDPIIKVGRIWDPFMLISNSSHIFGPNRTQFRLYAYKMFSWFDFFINILQIRFHGQKSSSSMNVDLDTILSVTLYWCYLM